MQAQGTFWEQYASFYKGIGFADVVLYLLLIFLMCMNWGLEAIKWQVLFSSSMHINYIQAFKAVLSGLSFANATPNRMGEFIGRIWHLPDEKKILGSSFTFVSGIAQLIVTVILGWCAVIWIIVFPYAQLSPLFKSILFPLAIVNPVILVFIFLTYFKADKIIGFFITIKWLQPFVNKMNTTPDLTNMVLVKVLFYSCLRYIVFVMQYWVVFTICHVHISIGDLWILLSFLFLILSAVPSVTFLELGMRLGLGIKIFGMISFNLLGIGLSMFIIWLVNLLLPSLIGSFFFLVKNKPQ